MAYAMHYKATGKGIEPKCPDYEILFSKAIQSKITARTSDGQVITVLYAIESALVTESSAFSFSIKITEPVVQNHIDSLETQLSRKWTDQLSGNDLLKLIYLHLCNKHFVLSAALFVLVKHIQDNKFLFTLFQNPQ